MMYAHFLFGNQGWGGSNFDFEKFLFFRYETEDFKLEHEWLSNFEKDNDSLVSESMLILWASFYHQSRHYHLYFYSLHVLAYSSYLRSLVA